MDIDKSVRGLCFHQILFLAQIFALLISFMVDYIEPSLSQLAYFVAVLSTPFLVLSFGYRYFQAERLRIGYFLQLTVELIFFIMYFGSLIYGIREYCVTLEHQKLYQSLLLLFIADTAISSLGFIMYRVSLRKTRSQSSWLQSVVPDRYGI